MIPPAVSVLTSQGRRCLHLTEEMYKMGNSGNKKAMEKVEEVREEGERSGQGHGVDFAENIKGEREGNECGKMGLLGSEFPFPTFILGWAPCS